MRKENVKDKVMGYLRFVKDAFKPFYIRVSFLKDGEPFIKVYVPNRKRWFAIERIEDGKLIASHRIRNSTKLSSSYYDVAQALREVGVATTEHSIEVFIQEIVELHNFLRDSWNNYAYDGDELQGCMFEALPLDRQC